jgi:Domain of unknown function (DUF4129)
MVGEQAPKAPRRGAARQPSELGRPPRPRTAGWPSAGRRIWPVLAAVALLLVVAVGSLRRPPGTGTGTPRYPSALLQTLGLLAFVAMLAAAVVAAWTLLPGKSKVVYRRRNPLFMPLLLMGFVLLLVLLRRLGWLERLGFPSHGAVPPLTSPGGPATAPGGRLSGGDPGWIPFVVVGTLLAGLAVTIMVRGELARRRRAALAGPGRQLTELLEGTLADLEDEPDPRRAVIAAWIRMEGGLAAAGLPRRAAEAPLEYVSRVLEQANVRPASIRRLADLFERAKFSQHTIDEAMRAAAIEAVTTIRAELRAEQARLREGAGAQPETRERQDAGRTWMVGRP